MTELEAQVERSAFEAAFFMESSGCLWCSEADYARFLIEKIKSSLNIFDL
jgi:hypothetical protein